MRLGRALLAAVLAVVPLSALAPGAAAAEPVCVAVTVDYRELAGRYGELSSYCAKVPNRSTGYEILVARARALGRPEPRSEGGLLCAIDGLPERGCGESADGGYRYWAYFHRQGDGSWQYSSRGAGDYRVIDDPGTSADDRPGEGWVWVEGRAEGSVTPARVPYDSTCPPESKSASPTTSPATSPRPSAGSTTATGAPRPAAARPGATTSPSTSRSPAATGSTSTTAAASAPAAAASAVVTEGRSVASPAPNGSTEPAATVGLTAEDDGIPVSTLVGVGVVAVIGGAAAARRRRERLG